MANKYNILKNAMILEFNGIEEESTAGAFDTRQEAIDAWESMKNDVIMYYEGMPELGEVIMNIDDEKYFIEIISEGDGSVRLYLDNLQDEDVIWN